jgi:pimeloyl-ACP methyl ester carboxylesterase
MRKDIEFKAEDGITLRGWHYLPDGGSAKYPTIVMAHGFSAVKEIYLDRFAEAFVEAGLASVVFDNRNFGASDGEPRQEIDPWAADPRLSRCHNSRRRIAGYRCGSDWYLGLELQRRARSGGWRNRSAGEVCGLAGAPDQRPRECAPVDPRRRVRLSWPTGWLATAARHRR